MPMSYGMNVNADQERVLDLPESNDAKGIWVIANRIFDTMCVDDIDQFRENSDSAKDRKDGQESTPRS